MASTSSKCWSLLLLFAVVVRAEWLDDAFEHFNESVMLGSRGSIDELVRLPGPEVELVSPRNGSRILLRSAALAAEMRITGADPSNSLPVQTGREDTCVCFGLASYELGSPPASAAAASERFSKFGCYVKSGEGDQERFVGSALNGGLHYISLSGVQPGSSSVASQLYRSGRPLGPLSLASFVVAAVGAGQGNYDDAPGLGPLAAAANESCARVPTVTFESPLQGTVVHTSGGKTTAPVTVSLAVNAPFSSSSAHSDDSGPAAEATTLWVDLFRGEGAGGKGAGELLATVAVAPRRTGSTSSSSSDGGRPAAAAASVASVRSVTVDLPVGLHALSAFAYGQNAGGARASPPGLAATVFLRVEDGSGSESKHGPAAAPVAGSAGLVSVTSLDVEASSSEGAVDDGDDARRLQALRSSLRSFVGGFEEMGGTYDTQLKNEALQRLARGLPSVTARGTPPRMCETGMNAGYSALTLLESSRAAGNNNATLTSFDLGEFGAAFVGKRWLDETFPGRHELVLGDSRTSLGRWVQSLARAKEQQRHVQAAATTQQEEEEEEVGGLQGTAEAASLAGEAFRCDLVFIDGGHEYDVVSADVLNFWRLVAPGAPVLFDDVHEGADCCPGVVRTWRAALDANVIEPRTAECFPGPNFCVGYFTNFDTSADWGLIGIGRQ